MRPKVAVAFFRGKDLTKRAEVRKDAGHLVEIIVLVLGIVGHFEAAEFAQQPFAGGRAIKNEGKPRMSTIDFAEVVRTNENIVRSPGHSLAL